MKRILQITLPVGIFAVGALIVWWIMSNQEEPRQRRFQPVSPQVVVRPLEEIDFEVILKTQGSVRARTQSSLIPEVRGRIISVSQNFQEGAFFEAGDVLLEIDDRDYQVELVVAEGALAQSELTLSQETARYEQARRDWDRLNPGQPASALTLREPQIRQARAAIASAQARVDTANLNLQRTKVTAPYAGRILTKSVDVGQYVSTGNELARIYAVDFAEVRLPLTATQVTFLNLPKMYRGSNPLFEDGPKVELSTFAGGDSFTYEGRIVRSEGSVDERTRQLFVVAQVEDPYGETVSGRPPLKVGTFVEAKIGGKILEDVILIPRRMYRENTYVLIVDDEDYLTRREVNVVWETDTHIVVRGGIKAGERLCTTDVPYALEGWQVDASLESDQVEDEMTAAAPVKRRRPSSPPASGGIGSRVDTLIAHFGEKLPEDLKEKLLSLKTSGDFSKIGPVMGEVGQWAKENELEMPPSNWGGGSRS